MAVFWYDISVPVKQGMVYTPSNPAIDGPVTMAMLEIIPCTGTHIDTPLYL